VYSVDLNDVAALRADVEWFCGELVDLPPAARLELVTELRLALLAAASPGSPSRR
jgi:hypothetical protein